jgi:hypothetical protein
MGGRHHLVIAGSGRTGTTVLVQLLAACGLDTGSDKLRYFSKARAGLESSLSDDAPYVVKNPYLSEELSQIIESGFDPERIDGIILPLRDLDNAASSRIQRFVESGAVDTPGGLWKTRRPGAQKKLLAFSVHRLLVTTAEHRIPLHLIAYPRFVNDAAYAWQCLKPVLPDLDDETFFEKHHESIREEFVHAQPHISRARMSILNVRWAKGKLWTWARTR